jgi:hypothetical protein
MNHVHFVTFLHRYIVSVDNKFRKIYQLWKRGHSISTETVMQFTEEHVNKRFQAHMFLYCVMTHRVQVERWDMTWVEAARGYRMFYIVMY